MTEDEYMIVCSINALQVANNFIEESYLGLANESQKSVIRKMITDLEKIIREQHDRLIVNE